MFVSEIYTCCLLSTDSATAGLIHVGNFSLCLEIHPDVCNSWYVYSCYSRLIVMFAHFDDILLILQPIHMPGPYQSRLQLQKLFNWLPNLQVLGICLEDLVTSQYMTTTGTL